MISEDKEAVPSAADIELIEAEAWAELQLCLPQELRSRLGIRVQRVAGAVLLLSSAPELAINRVIGLGLGAPLSERQLNDVCTAYSAAAIERYLVQWSPAAAPSCVPEWLATRGFRVVSTMAKLYRSTDGAPGEDVADPAMRVVEIGPSEAEDYERIVAGPLGVPDGLGPGIRSTIGQPGWRYYLVLDGERPIAGAALYVRGRHGWFGLGATLDGDRRRGAQTALLARRLRDAASDGCVWVSADTLAETLERPNPSYRNMRRAGFTTLYERPNFLHGAQATARPSA